MAGPVTTDPTDQTAWEESLLRGILQALEAATPAGSALIGKVGIDQVTTGANTVTVGNPSARYVSPNTKSVETSTTLDSLFSDDFGGSAVDTTNNWDVLDGGLSANGANLTHTGTITQGAIGTGTTGMTDSVSASGLTVSMNTTSGAERWYLSKQAFAGKEDILVLLSRSQALAANSIFIGLCEVDPTTLVPLLNPNFASEFTNRGGCEFGLTTTTTAFQAEAIGDSSAAKATGVVGVAGAALTTTQEYLIEIDSRDIIVSNSAVDSVAAKIAAASRVSSQCPNDKKLYKLVMRFKNVSAPGSNTSVVVQRVLVVDNYEQRVQISTGEGDTVGAKSVGVNVNNVASVSIASGGVNLTPSFASGPTSTHKLTAAATTNATNVKNSTGTIHGGSIRNRSASEKYFKLYNKASAPTVGTDVPVITIGVGAGLSVPLGEFIGTFGLRLNSGISYAITGAYADADTTVVVAGDVDVNLIYS